MPSIYLEDHELIEMILERPHLIGQAIEKLIKDLEEERSFGWDAYANSQKLRNELKELKEKLGGETND